MKKYDYIKRLIDKKEKLEQQSRQLLEKISKCEKETGLSALHDRSCAKLNALTEKFISTNRKIAKLSECITKYIGPFDISEDKFDEIENCIEKLPEFGKKVLEIASSYNECIYSPISCIFTKLVIVGTITPSNNAGYYYTSRKTKMYEILDNCLGTHMNDLKNNPFHQNSEGHDLINMLTGSRIGFIDVFSKVIRKKNSAMDKDIIYGVLDDKAFERLHVELDEKTIFVANSKLAFDLCQRIFDRNKFYKFVLHDEVCTIFKRNDLKGMINKWNEVLKKYNIHYDPNFYRGLITIAIKK